MSLQTHSKFYYGYVVTADAFTLDFQEGADDPIFAEMDLKSYTLTDFAAELSRALNAAGTLEYTVTVERSTRKITVAATGVFTILTTSGDHLGTTAWGLAGFSGADTSSASSHQGSAAGTSYRTQFILQSYIQPEDYQGSTYGTVNKAASGRKEVVSFGTENFFQCEFKYLNDIYASGPIRNVSSVDDFRALLRYFVTQGPFEFMPDEDDDGEVITATLETTADDSKGLKFKLRELYGIGLPGFFESGTLMFRVRGDDE